MRFTLAVVARLLCAAVLAVALGACKSEFEKTMEEVRRSEEKHEYSRALAALLPQVNADPGNKSLRSHLGRLHLALFDGAAGEHEFRKAAELGLVDGGRVTLGLGRALSLQGRHQEIIDSIRPSPAFEAPVLASLHALRAGTALVLGQYRLVLSEFEEARRIDSQNVDVIIVQAQMLASSRNAEGAVKLLDDHLSQDPKPLLLWLHKAHLLTVLGRYDKAIASYQEVLAREPQHREALAGRAILLMTGRRNDDAQRDADQLRNFYAKHLVTAYVQGQLYFWRREYGAAQEFAQRALKANPKDTSARLLSAMSGLALGSTAYAESELARYVAQHPRSEYARRILGELRLEIEQGDGKAASALASILSEDLKKASVHGLQDELYSRLAQHSKIAEWLEWYAASEQVDLMIGTRHVEKRFAPDQIRLAIDDLERVATLSADAAAADAAWVLACIAHRDFTKAIASANAFRKKSPTSAPAAYLLALAYSRNGQVLEALPLLQEAIATDASYLPALVHLHEIAADRKAAAHALREPPKSVATYVYHARVQELSGRTKAARELLEKAIELDPRASEPKIALTGLLKKEGNKDQARLFAEQCSKLASDDPVALEVAADLWTWSGDKHAGVEALKRLVKADAGSPQAYFKLARAQYMAGLKTEAGASLGRALRIPVDDPSWLPRRTGAALIIEDHALDALEKARKLQTSRPRSGASGAVESEIWNVRIEGG